ncbi:MAG: carbon storage regulator [Planctomycetota bacterium]|nr:MAG: carbon storage regulator [Planctomycetota bacterium]
MLILSRRAQERICLGDDIVLTVVSIGTERVRISVSAPPHIRILRSELEEKKPAGPGEDLANHPADREATITRRAA